MISIHTIIKPDYNFTDGTDNNYRSRLDRAYAIQVEIQTFFDNHRAAREYDLDESTIRGWRKNKSQLEEGPKTKRANRGPKEGKHPELEQAVFDWFEARRQSGYNVSRLAIRFRALRLAKSGKFPAESFTASQGWCTRFMKRNQLSLRQRTKIAQKLPHELDEKVLSFQKYVIARRKFFEFPLSRIGNMDETPMFFYMPGTRTVNKAGEKTVLVRTTGNEKNHFTVRWFYHAWLMGPSCHPWSFSNAEPCQKISSLKVSLFMCVIQVGWTRMGLSCS